VEMGGLLLILWVGRGSVTELPAQLPRMIPSFEPEVWLGITAGAFVAFYAFIGFESLSQKNLSKMNKGWNTARGYGEAVRRIHGAGINIVASFVFGLDDDDPGVFQRTYDFIMENHISAAQFHILTPLPGTGTYARLESEGRIRERDWARYHTGEVVFEPRSMSAAELLAGYHAMYHRFYSMKNILRRSIASPRNLVYRVAVNLSYRKKALKMPG